MTKEYDGPGEYEVTVMLTGTVTVTVEADSAQDASRKARFAYSPFDVELDIEDTAAVCKFPAVPDETLMERMSAIEQASWMLNGKVPTAARERITLEERLAVMQS